MPRERIAHQLCSAKGGLLAHTLAKLYSRYHYFDCLPVPRERIAHQLCSAKGGLLAHTLAKLYSRYHYFDCLPVPRERIELSTRRFSVYCSTTELPRLITQCSSSPRRSRAAGQAELSRPILLRGPDSNRRPPGYGPSELPTALPRVNIIIN